AAAVTNVPAAELEKVTAHVAADFLIEAVGLAFHIPDLGAPPPADILDGEPCDPALPLDSFLRLRIFKVEELSQPQHVRTVITEAGLRHPRPAVEYILEGEAILRVIKGAIV